jgi:hypothetical protein
MGDVAMAEALPRPLPGVAVADNLGDLVQGEQLRELGDHVLRGERRLAMAHRVDDEEVILLVSDREGRGRGAAARVYEGAVEDAVDRRPLLDARRDAGLQGLAGDEALHVGPELGEPLRRLPRRVGPT